MILIAIFVAFTVICAFVTLPLGSIPFTLQTLAVFLSAALLGFKRAFVVNLIYIMLGAVGLPVFSGFSGGFGVLLGATGGYILGLLLITAVVGIVRDRLGFKIKQLILSMLVGLLLCYTFGALWFACVYNSSSGIGSVLLTTVVPFVLPDVFKAVVAVAVASRLVGIVDKRL